MAFFCVGSIPKPSSSTSCETSSQTAYLRRTKTAYRVNNWPEYDKALRDRGDITLWISHEAIDAWTPPPNGRRGAQPRYAAIAIETALSLRLLEQALKLYRYVSPGHLCDMDTAIEVVLQATPKYRLPAPIRAAHDAANNLRRAQTS